MKNRITIDRIDGDIAVCERDDGRQLNIGISEFPPNAREGDVFIKNNGSWIRDTEEETARKNRILKLMQKLFR